MPRTNTLVKTMKPENFHRVENAKLYVTFVRLNCSKQHPVTHGYLGAGRGANPEKGKV